MIKKTAEKWVLENNRELNMSVWLKFDVDHDHVVALKCAVCTGFKKERSRSVFEYAPIARSLANVSIDEGTREVLRRKFEVAYFIARKKLAFAKMQPLCELEERHGVKLGLGYKNYHACSTFVEFIARDLQQNQLAQINSRSKFFSLQADASTNSGNVENEIISHSLL